VNDTDKGFVDHEISTTKHAMLDLYGRCEQLSIVPCNKIPELRSVEHSEEDVKSDVEEEKVSTDESKGSTCLLCKAGLEIAGCQWPKAGHILKMAGKNKFEASRKKMAGEIL
jgi:hypothetical protein